MHTQHRDTSAYECAYHEEWDADGQPIGEPCAAEPTHLIVWPENRLWSFSCDRHADPAIFAPEAAPRRIFRLEEEAAQPYDP